jgi:hypothetical protein
LLCTAADAYARCCGPCLVASVCRALLEAVLGKGAAAAKAAAGQQRKRLPAAARNAVVAEAYNESEAHATAAGARTGGAA